MTEPLSVSIVIPAYNEESSIRHCLMACIDQSSPAAEIIVVNNRSTDGTVAAVGAMQAAFPEANIRLIHQNDVQGITATRNAGFNAATSTVIGRIDSDSAIMPNWVEQVQRAFADGTIDAASGSVDYYDMPMRAFGHIADNAYRTIQAKLAGEYVFLFGSNMALRRDAWEAVRDEVHDDREDLMHEDLDLAIHLAMAGRRIAYVSAMEAGMSARRLDSSPKDYLFYVERFKRTYAAHGIHDPRLLAPMVVLLGVYPALHAERAISGRRGAARTEHQPIEETP